MVVPSRDATVLAWLGGVLVGGDAVGGDAGGEVASFM
jgi:hypothetical protein